MTRRGIDPGSWLRFWIFRILIAGGASPSCNYKLVPARRLSKKSSAINRFEEEPTSVRIRNDTLSLFKTL